MKFRLLLVGLGTSAITVLSACGNGPPPDQNGGGGGGSGGGGGGGAISLVDSGTAATSVKEMDTLKFAPDAVTVKAGDVVEFNNAGSVAHNVTFDSGVATNGNMAGGDKALFKFASAGTYKYQCTLHAGMIGTVTVG